MATNILTYLTFFSRFSFSSNIVLHLQKQKTHPVSGEPLTTDDLIKLKFYRNASGEYACPITEKAFSKFSKIVAIATSGNVYLLDAVQRLNIDTGSWNDLMSGEAFTASDIITLQDPVVASNANTVVPSKLPHNTPQSRPSELPGIRLNPSTRRIFKDLEDSKGKREHHPEWERAAAPDRSQLVVTMQEAARWRWEAHQQWAREQHQSEQQNTNTSIPEAPNIFPELKPQEKAYVAVDTTLGTLNCELFCHIAPLACENFLHQCRVHYYDQSPFHRVIAGFMAQSGDPAERKASIATSKWNGRPFVDETQNALNFRGRGLLAAANSGPHSNKSQWFVTFADCEHLNRKHTIFGRVVGGLEVLDKLEAVEIGVGDRPKALGSCLVLGTRIFVDPFEDALQAVQTSWREKQRSTGDSTEKEKVTMKAKERERQGQVGSEQDKDAARMPLRVNGSGPGKYVMLPAPHKPTKRAAAELSSVPSTKRNKPSGGANWSAF
mgnify:CR=1 FL=1